ncbi:MAG: hypothetical protein M3552_12915, partial [Planctomycetota bacterium]|nr:hypothetical protein [Planctomycetota bacterium]
RIETDEDEAELRDLIESHRRYTGSAVAASILDEWDDAVKRFVKVMPIDYKRALAELASEEQSALEHEPQAEALATPGGRD